MTAGWGCRATRAAVFAAVCVLLAALGHVMMSQTQVPWWALGAGAAATGGAAWVLAGRERGLPLVVSVAVAAQAALHSGFSLAQTLASPPAGGTSVLRQWVRTVLCLPPEDGGAMSMGRGTDAGARGMGMGGDGSAVSGALQHAQHMQHMRDMPGMRHSESMQTAMETAMGHAGEGGHMHHMGGMSPIGMLAAHLLAALLCGLWLAHGERAVFRVARAFVGRLAAPLRLPVAVPAPGGPPRVRPRRSRSVRTPRQFLLVHAITSRGPPAGTAVA
ncbi:hypothetical protein ACIBKX_34970 [Streptomyces sp. NPDC050658]|uniref:hypothetical protein n=1 Tax=unclassified Streptomyces TaxID=2593676 RepID=UPI003432C723